MISGKGETRVCEYIRSEFIHWALWRTLMKIEYFLFVHHTTCILIELSSWCFEHSGGVSVSLIVNLSHTDESWEGRNTCLWIYIYIYKYIFTIFALQYLLLHFCHLHNPHSSLVIIVSLWYYCIKQCLNLLINFPWVIRLHWFAGDCVSSNKCFRRRLLTLENFTLSDTGTSV